MDLKLTLEILFDKSSWPMILSTWSRDFLKKYVLFGKFCTTFLTFLLLCNFQEQLHILQEKSRDHIRDVILRPYLSRGNLNVSFQLIPC